MMGSTKHILEFEGTHIFKANPIVIEKLKEAKRLLSNGKLKHSYPHSWRSKTPLVHRAPTMVYFYGKSWIKKFSA